MRLTLKERFQEQVDGALRDPWGAGPVALAVSGGGDSTALMHLAAQTIDPERLHVLTVDHGLRDVAGEIELVAKQAGELGLRHEVLTWVWNGTGNLQAEARIGRWAAIETYCASLDGEVCCMTGHTREDQAETVLMRLARGSGVAGLAGMQPYGAAPDGLRIFRPLLDETRAELREWLTGGGISWSDDPSNEDPRFDRVRARQMQAELAKLGLTTDRLAQTAAHMQAARRELVQYSVMIAKEYASEYAGDVLFPVEWDDHRDVAQRLFRHALHHVGGGAYPPRSDAALALWDAAQTGQGGTLHGCLVTVDGDALRVTREFAATQASVLWANRVCGKLWDNRWLVSDDTGGDSKGDLSIRALGESLKDVPDWRDVGLPRASLMASPAVFDGETLISAPVAGLQNGFSARIVADFMSFLLSR
ncbi:MAG TPA: tRNA lysidine(34) synthetase TilS [Octadecabacter sp.]|nr:tRNA lysidine(34) synthetase TilS [Octadecabacter sp.]